MPGFAPAGQGVQVDRGSGRSRQVMTLAALLQRIGLAAGPYASRYSTYPASDLTPEAIVAARRQAHQGYPMQWCEMVEEILERNTHIKACSHKRRSWIYGVPCRVDPPEQFKDDLLAKFVAGWCTAVIGGIDRAAWVRTLYNLLSAAAYGFATAEVFWNWRTVSFTGPDGRLVNVPGVLVPTSCAPLHQKHWRFGLHDDRPLLWAGQGVPGINWPWGKFIVNLDLGDGVAGRCGYMTAGTWMDLAIQNGWAALIVFMAKYGLPQLGLFIERVIDTQGTEREKIDELVENYGEAKIAVLDGEMDMRQVAKVDGDIIHQDVIKLGQLECSKLILGGTLVIDQGNDTGSYNMGDNHASGSAEYTRAPDSAALSTSIDTHLLAPAIEMNIDQIVAAAQAAGIAADASMVRQRLPQSAWRTIEREPSGTTRLELLRGVQELVGPQGFAVDPEQVSRELSVTLIKCPPSLIAVPSPGAPIPQTVAARVEDGGPQGAQQP